MDIRTVIRLIRIQNNLTQAELAELYHIPVRTLEDWESGSRKCPQYVTDFLYQIYAMDRIRSGDVAVFIPNEEAEQWSKAAADQGFESLQVFCMNKLPDILFDMAYTVVEKCVDIPWKNRNRIFSLCADGASDEAPNILKVCYDIDKAHQMVAEHPPVAEKMKLENGDTVIRLTETYIYYYYENEDCEPVGDVNCMTPWEFHWDDEKGIVITHLAH